MVPAGSAGHIPYMAFLARGRDVDKPAVIVLLDADQAGDDAVKALKRGGPRSKQVVAPEFVLQLSSSRLDGLIVENPNGLSGIEDLVPVSIAVESAKSYAAEYVPEADLSEFSPAPADIYQGGKDTLAGIVTMAAKQLKSPGFHIDKIGFARHVVASTNSDQLSGSHKTLSHNFGTLLRTLAEIQREALRVQSEELVKDRINRIRDRFTTDHPDGARKEEALLLIEEVQAQLDDSEEADVVRTQMRAWIRTFKLDDDPRSAIEDFTAFSDALVSLAYLGTRRAQGEDS